MFQRRYKMTVMYRIKNFASLDAVIGELLYRFQEKDIAINRFLKSGKCQEFLTLVLLIIIYPQNDSKLASQICPRSVKEHFVRF